MTATIHSLRNWFGRDRADRRVCRLVRVDLIVAATALAVIVTVSTADHASQGNLSALAGLLGH